MAEANEQGSHQKIFKNGDVVRLVKMDRLKQIFESAENTFYWHPTMAKACGCLGKVLSNKVSKHNTCVVELNGYAWRISTKALTPAPGEVPPFVPYRTLSHARHAAVACDSVDDLKQCCSFSHRQNDYTLEMRADVLLNAAFEGSIRCAKYLIKHHLIDPYFAGTTGAVSLNTACYQGDAEMIELLMESGAMASVFDADGSKASLHICALNGCVRGCEIILRKCPYLVNWRTQDGSTALTLASRHGHLPVVMYLLAFEECDIDRAAGNDGKTTPALQLTIRYGHFHIAEHLIRHGINLNLKDYCGDTALSCAMRPPQLPVTSGPELDKISSTLSPLLDDIPMKSSVALACLLVREGADLNYILPYTGRALLEYVLPALQPHLLRYAEERSTFHGSWKRSLEPTLAPLAELGRRRKCSSMPPITAQPV